MLPYLLLPALAVSFCYADEIESTLLIPGHTWVYEQVIKAGPTVPRVVFDGVSKVQVDSTTNRTDSLFIWTSVQDSSKALDTVYASQQLHVLTNSKIVLLNMTGTRPPTLQNEPPYFLLGFELVGAISQVRFKDSLHTLKSWHNFPASGYGRTMKGSILQDIGMIEYSIVDFGPLARDSRTLWLISFNGVAFDSSQLEPVALFANRARFNSKSGSQIHAHLRRFENHDLLGRFNLSRKEERIEKPGRANHLPTPQNQ